jgi:DNA-binding transcriptional LysR family regulator
LARRYRAASVPLKAFADETFVAEPGGELRAAAFAAFRAAGFTPHTGQEAPNTSALNLVAAGLGIAFVPASLHRLRMDGVSYCHLKDGARLTAPLNLVSRRGDPSAAVGHFLSLVKKAARRFTEA